MLLRHRGKPTSSAQKTCQRSMPAANGHVGTQSLSCKPGGAMGMCDMATDTDTAADLDIPECPTLQEGLGLPLLTEEVPPAPTGAARPPALPCDCALIFTGKLNTRGAQGRRVGWALLHFQRCNTSHHGPVGGRTGPAPNPGGLLVPSGKPTGKQASADSSAHLSLQSDSSASPSPHRLCGALSRSSNAQLGHHMPFPGTCPQAPNRPSPGLPTPRLRGPGPQLRCGRYHVLFCFVSDQSRAHRPAGWAEESPHSPGAGRKEPPVLTTLQQVPWGVGGRGLRCQRVHETSDVAH